MDEGGVVLERLHEVRHQRVLEEHGHGARRLDVLGQHLALVALRRHHDLADAAFEVFDGGREAEDRHDLGGDSDIEARLARETIGDAAQRTDDLAQRAVVHVHHAAPGHAARVDAELVAPIDVVVDHRREEIVRRSDRMEIAGEVEVDVFHRHDLGIAAAGRAALHAEARAEGWLAQGDHGLLADAIEAVAQANGRRRLALAGGRRIDRRDQDELPSFLEFEACEIVETHLGFGMAVGDQVLLRNAQLLADLHDRLHFGFARDLDVAFDGHGALSSGRYGVLRRNA